MEEKIKSMLEGMDEFPSTDYGIEKESLVLSDNEPDIQSGEQTITREVLDLEKQQEQAEKAKAFLKTPEGKAAALFEKWIMDMPYTTGPQRRKMYRKLVRECKMGRYDHLFDEEKIANRNKRLQEKFEKLNASKVVKESKVEDGLRDKIKEMAEQEPPKEYTTLLDTDVAKAED